MPPAPSGETISYGPSLVPEVRAMRARNYNLGCTFAADATVLGVLSANRKLSRNGLRGDRQSEQHAVARHFPQEDLN